MRSTGVKGERGTAVGTDGRKQQQVKDMRQTVTFKTAQEVRFGRLLAFIIPTYLTSLFNTLYTIVDGIFVASYVGTDALAAISIGAGKKREADSTFSVSVIGALLIGSLMAFLIILNLSPVLRMRVAAYM